MTRPLAVLLAAAALAAGCGADPPAQGVAEPVPATAPRAVSVADSLFLAFEDFLYGSADPVLSTETFDTLAARFNAQRWNEAVVDTLDFDGDGVADRLLASPGRGGLNAALYLADGDSLVQVRHEAGLHLGQSYAVCHEPGRSARILTFQAVGVHFDVWASELRLTDGQIESVSDEGFSVWPDGSPDAEAARTRMERRAGRLEARTEGPPPGCAFRCTYFDCCAAGRCSDGGRAPWHPRGEAAGA